MKSKSIFASRFSLLPCITSVVLIPSLSFAGDYTWDGDVSGAWNVGNNWVGNPNGGSAPSMGAGSIQTFSGATANLATFIGANRVIGTLNFDANADSNVSIRFSTTAGGTTSAPLTFDVLSGNAAINVASGATGNFTLGGAGNMIINDNLVITHEGTGNLTIDKQIQPASGVTTTGLSKAGSGMLTLSGNNTFAGGFKLYAGTLNININSALGFASSGGVFLVAGGTIDNTSADTVTKFNHLMTIDGNFAFTGTQNLDLGTGAVNLGTAAGTSRTITANAGVLTIGGIISDGTTANSLTKDGAGTLTLTAASTYTGATTISAGTLSASSIVVVSGGSNLGNATTSVTLGSASSQGTLSYTGSSATYTRGFTIGGAGGGRLDVTTSGQTLTVGTGGVTGSGLFTIGGAGNTTISSAITHTGGLTKNDSGTLTFSGAVANTYNGGTVINAGILAINLIANLPNALTNGGAAAGAFTVASGATLSVSSNVTAANIANLGGTTGNFLTGSYLGFTAGTKDWSSSIPGIQGLHLLNGTLTLSAANTFSGDTKITAGKLSLTNSFALQNSAVNTTASSNGTTTLGLSTALTSLTFGGLIGNKDLASVFISTGGGYNGVASLTLNPGTGVTHSYSGIIANGASGMTLNKTGDGTQILTGASTYSGSTSIKAGYLLVGDGISGSLASPSVTVGGNGSSGTPTLGGRGTIAGATTISSAGTGVVGIHSPGIAGTNGGVGTQTFSNSLTYQAGSIFQWDLKTGATGTAGTDFDAVTLNTASGSLSMDDDATTGSIFKVVLGDTFIGNSFWSDPGQKSWNVFAATNGATLGANVFSRFQLFDTSSATVPVDFSSYGSFGFTNNGSTGTLTWTAVPEPTSTLAGILLGVGLLRRRRG